VLGWARGGFHRRQLRTPVRPGFGVERKSNRGKRRETRFRPGAFIRRLCGCLVTSASKGRLPARGRRRSRRRAALQLTERMRMNSSSLILTKGYGGLVWPCWAEKFWASGGLRRQVSLVSFLSFSLFYFFFIFCFVLFSIFCFEINLNSILLAGFLLY
jgi:hypothetical protein